MEIKPDNFKRELGLLDGTMLVVGSMIGSGIFIASSDMVRQLGSAGWLIAMWVLTGVITVTAVSYGELSDVPTAADSRCILRKLTVNWVLYGWSFCGDPNRYYCGCGVALPNLRLDDAPLSDDKIFLYEDFKPNAAKIDLL
jgi:APA family basic amino acid/polyamine antiporter